MSSIGKSQDELFRSTVILERYENLRRAAAEFFADAEPETRHGARASQKVTRRTLEWDRAVARSVDRF